MLFAVKKDDTHKENVLIMTFLLCFLYSALISSDAFIQEVTMKKAFFIIMLLVSLVFVQTVFSNQQLSPATFNDSTNTVHIPYFKFDGNNYWLDLKLIGDNPLQFQVVNFGQNTYSNSRNCEACATYDIDNKTLFVPYFEFNGSKYWLTFKLEFLEPVIFTFLSFGTSQINEQQTYTDPVTKMEFVKVKGDCYEMGDTFGDGQSDERPVHKVCVDNFYIGKYEVTQREWKKIMGSNPSGFKSCGDYCPVERVSWNDVQEFIRELNNKPNRNFRLPTEAEWEFAARSGGKNEKYSGGDDADSVAWYWNNSNETTHPVGQKEANELGIYDMSGNVWEWCLDRYDENYYNISHQNNPQGPDNGSTYVLRGGGWKNYPKDTRTTNRSQHKSYYRYYNLGFRLAISASLVK